MRARVLHLALLSLAVSTFCVGQTVGTGKTVRKHRETVQDQVITPEVTRAEAAMEANNFDAAEKDLAAVVAKDPKNYRAWFDLGFVYNETSRTPQAIDAYRKSVEANPQVFESTLNLGLLLARSGDPNAEKFLRDAT